MHEISLCLSALELIEDQARRHGGTRITGVWLEIGALSCIEEEALRFCFDSACRHTSAEGCRLRVSYVPARAWCWQCGTLVSVQGYDEGCPRCGSHALRVESGDQLQVKQIEVE